ncbi:Flp pilus assembly protein CpaB [Idiomarina xiamenensis]|uniref:Flp pilus assembly protein CpaB n=1 Tax=Idiomarina xiamenensis 10-D-4 TaxID=740709 RepID=K2K5C6_9GAMM|nr:Flp pilus assembly protein CpaB [Idiomarina xiamenensis]EKE82763.1 Flp pilus assembly protein CpaB [Idiomarina xiamenensis 10-D-4]
MRWQPYQTFMVVIIAALILTVLTVTLISRYVERQQQQALSAQQPTMLTVVVAADALAVGTRIEQQHLRQRRLPDNGLAGQWLAPEHAATLLGRRLAVAVEAGQPLAFNLLQPAAAALSEVLQAQHYALTLSADLLNSHHGLIQLGDRLDMEFLDGAEPPILALPVVAIDQHLSQTALSPRYSSASSADLSGGFIPQSLTLALTAEQRRRYQRASTAGVRLWLRSRLMAANVEQVATAESAAPIRISYLKQVTD